MKYSECGSPQPLVGTRHGAAKHTDRVRDIRTSVSSTVEESTAETLVPLHEIRRRDVSVLAREHGVGNELRKILTGWCLGGFGEVLLRDALGTPRGHHTIDVCGLVHGDLVLAAIDLGEPRAKDPRYSC